VFPKGIGTQWSLFGGAPSGSKWLAGDEHCQSWWPIPEAYDPQQLQRTSVFRDHQQQEQQQQAQPKPPDSKAKSLTWVRQVPLPPRRLRPQLVVDPQRQAHHPETCIAALRDCGFPCDVYDVGRCPLGEALFEQARRRSEQNEGVQRSLVWPVFIRRARTPQELHGMCSLEAAPEPSDRGVGVMAGSGGMHFASSGSSSAASIPKGSRLVGPIGFMCMSDDPSIEFKIRQLRTHEGVTGESGVNADAVGLGDGSGAEPGQGPGDSRHHSGGRQRNNCVLVMLPAGYRTIFRLVLELYRTTEDDPTIQREYETQSSKKELARPSGGMRYIRSAVGRVPGW